MNFLTGVAAVLLISAHTASAVGGNDDFAQRRILPSMESVDFAVRRPASLTYEPLDPMARSDYSPYSSERQGSLWWEWTAPRDGWFAVAVETPRGDSLETYVFQGTSLERLVPMQNGNHLGLTLLNSTLFEAKQGQRYQIGSRIWYLPDDGNPGAGRVADLTLRPSPGPPANDTLERRAVLSGPLPVIMAATNLAPASLEGSMLSRMSAVGSTYAFPSVFGPVLWWEWTAPETGRFDLRIDGIHVFTFVARRRELEGGFAGAAGEWENTLLDVQGQTFVAEAGSVYDIAVLTPASHERSHHFGDFSLQLCRAALTGPANMSQETAGQLPGTLPFHYTSYWQGGPVPTDGSGMMHLWWKFTAPVTGIYQFEYRDWSPTLHFDKGVTGSYGSLQMLRAGENLWMEYTLFPAQEINVDIAASLLPAPPANDMIADAADMGSAVEFDLLGHRDMATLEPGEPWPAFETSEEIATGSLWWRWTAPGKGWLRKVSGRATSVPLDVFDGTNLDSPGDIRELRHTLAVESGQVCYIRAGFSPLEQYALCSVHLDFLPYPSNIAPALATNLGVTAAPAFHQPRTHPAAPLPTDLWFRWIAAEDGRCDFVHSEMADDAVIYTDPPAGTVLPRDPSSDTWEFRAGLTYWLKYTPWSTRTSFEMLREPLTVNGDIATALVLGPELPATATATTRGDINSTAEVDVLGGFLWGNLENSPAVWWRWQAPRDQWVRCHCDAINSGLNSFHILSGSHPNVSVVAMPAPFDSEARYFKASRDETYWFAAVGHSDSALSSQFVRLDLRPVVETGPHNDYFDGSAAITRSQWNAEEAVFGIHRGNGNRHPLRYEWTQATLEPNEPPVSLVIGEEGHAVEQTASTWWHWTAPASGLYKMILRPSDGLGFTTRNPRSGGGGGNDPLMDLTATIYTGTALSALQPIMLYEPFAGEYCFRGHAGTRYSIRVASGGEREFYVLQPMVASHEDIFDFWAIEQLLFEGVGDAYASYARDGVPNYLKLIFGFDPWLPVTHPDHAAARANLPRHIFTNGMLEMRCRPDLTFAPGGNPEYYFLFGFASTDLSAWDYLAPAALPNGELSLRLPMNAPRGFMMWDPFTFDE